MTDDELIAEIKKRRANPVYMARLEASMARNKVILDRLKENGD